MKIIDRLTDEQLQELYSSYNYNNMLEEYDDCFPFIIVPKLLSLGNIELSDYNACFLDKDGYVYSRSHAAGHLLKFTGLTFQELFDLTVLHINDTNDRPKCSNPSCNNKVNWSGRFTAGYGSGGHRWNESKFHYCSHECAKEVQFNYPEYYKNYYEFINSGGTFGLIQDTDYDLWTDMQIRSRMTNFINLGDPLDKCYFYVTWTSNGLFKFGITQNIELRESCSKLVISYLNPRIIKTGTRVDLAKFEAEIKSRLNIYYEYLDNESDINKFWKIFKELNLTN